MAPMDHRGVAEVANLIQQEMAEQAKWEIHIPAWHPTNRVENPPADPPVNPPVNPPKDPPVNPPKDDAQAAVDAAYAKLREAEKERDRLAAIVKKGERSGMEETERLKAEAEDARNEAAALQEKLDEIEWRGTVQEVATTLKFRNAAMALKFVDKDSTDAKAIKKDLEAAIKDIPELVKSDAPPPPVNDGTKNTNGSENDRMNAALRKAAGRA
jgi:hypothetical protein